MRPVRPAVALTTLLLVGCGSATRPVHSPSAGGPSASHAPSAAAHFEYTGEHGPEHWGTLDPAWSACSTGRQQSPVDLTGGTGADLPNLVPDYRASAWRVLDTGHSLQVVPAEGSTLEAAGRTWSLKQFHVHTPSEHTVDGRAAQGEVHFVHVDAAGKLLVVGALLVEGKENPAWAWLSEDLPTEPGSEHVRTELASPRQLLGSNLAHRTYTGSLTTPPCTEGVTWVVLDEPVILSTAQLERISRVGGRNARPVQQLEGRAITHDDTPLR